ncbi:hypothetical protein OK396_00830 [Streptococcus pneumoniae]|nr:hypothetical protein [Streptococcus pneumoniae]
MSSKKHPLGEKRNHPGSKLRQGFWMVFRLGVNNWGYIIALPTDYDEKIGSFNTYEIEQTVSKILRVKPNGKIILKSTVPIGFSNKLKRLFDTKNIIFVPEFLREGCSIYDNLYPSRIVVGDETVEGRKIAELFLSISTHSTANIKNVMLVSPTEAEAIKLFSNTFLALRVAFLMN